MISGNSTKKQKATGDKDLRQELCKIQDRLVVNAFGYQDNPLDFFIIFFPNSIQCLINGSQKWKQISSKQASIKRITAAFVKFLQKWMRLNSFRSSWDWSTILWKRTGLRSEWDGTESWSVQDPSEFLWDREQIDSWLFQRIPSGTDWNLSRFLDMVGLFVQLWGGSRWIPLGFMDVPQDSFDNGLRFVRISVHVGNVCQTLERIGQHSFEKKPIHGCSREFLRDWIRISQDFCTST